MHYWLIIIILISSRCSAATESYVLSKKRLYQQSKVFSDWKKMPARNVKISPLSQFKATEPDKNINKPHSKKFFHTQKQQQRWWLINPQGERYLSIAANSVRQYTSHYTPFTSNTAVIDSIHPSIWRYSVLNLWQQAGLNGFGAWSDIPSLFKQVPNNKNYHYSINLNCLGGYRKQSGQQRKVLAIFDPEFQQYCQKEVAKYRTYHQDTQLLGYFTDNEINFWGIKISDYLALNDPRNPNYHATRQWLKAQKMALTSPFTDAQNILFRRFVLAHYLKITTRSILAHDSNHLIMGPRLYHHEKNNPLFMKTLGQYVDIVAINYYGKWQPTAQEMANWTEWSGKPFLVSEFYVKAKNTGLNNISGAGWLVNTQTDRGLFYQNFVLSLLESKHCIGWHWYRYQDARGKQSANKGLVDKYYQSYPDLIHLMYAINHQAYQLADELDRKNP